MNKIDYILITRPYEDFIRTKEEIGSMNLPIYHLPLTEIIINPIRESNILNYDTIIITSHKSLDYLKHHNLLLNQNIILIGEYSYQKAIELYSSNKVKKVGDTSKDLIKFLKESNRQKFGRTIYIRGKNITNDLVTDFYSDDFLAYEAKEKKDFPAEIKDLIYSEKSGIITFFSKRNVKIFEKIIIDNSLERFLPNLFAVAFSKEIGQELIKHPLQKLVWCNTPNLNEVKKIINEIVASK
ncbi:MAG: uroporphyrinogen-III synthase [Sphingobacteriia bacterium]|nr:uroporphyrinogen-III synthase [Sphingobacteriia bacterium]